MNTMLLSFSLPITAKSMERLWTIPKGREEQLQVLPCTANPSREANTRQAHKSIQYTASQESSEFSSTSSIDSIIHSDKAASRTSPVPPMKRHPVHGKIVSLLYIHTASHAYVSPTELLEHNCQSKTRHMDIKTARTTSYI